MNRVRTSPRVKLVEDLQWHARETFSQKLKESFKITFDVEISTFYNLNSFNLVTTRVDEKELTEAQVSFIAGFEFAWQAVLEIAEKIK